MQQVFFSIILLVVQVICAFWSGSIMTVLVSTGGFGLDGWIVFGVFLLGMVLYGWLLLRCGACAIGVSSDNRSTPIRIPLLVIGLLGCMLEGFMIVSYATKEYFPALIGLAAISLFIHWGVSGSLIMGERGTIPARARRSLPSSLMGRVFLTWLNPGAGPGYIFVLLSFAGSAFSLMIAPTVLLYAGDLSEQASLAMFLIALTCYLALYLGVVRLFCMVFLRHLLVGRLVLSFTMTIVVIVMAVVITCSINLAANDYQLLSFDWYCFPNLFWTLAELFPDRNGAWGSPEELFAVIALLVTTLPVVFVNVLLTAKDVVLLRIETPERVKEEREKRRSSSKSEPTAEEIDPVFG